MTGHPVIFFGGGELPWIYPLGVELSRTGPTTLIRIATSFARLRKLGAWAFEDQTPALDRRTWIYPPGYNRILGFVFHRFIRLRLERLVEHQNAAYSYVVVPKPQLRPYVEGVPRERLVYFVYDDYSTYGSEGRRRENPEEDRFVQRAGTVICSSLYRTRSLQDQVGREDSIFHLPHGVHTSFLNNRRSVTPVERRICIVGALTARYDWHLIDRVIHELEDVSFQFVGEIDGGGRGTRKADFWKPRMEKVLSYPNVEYVPGIRHRDRASVYWKAAASWIPYKADLEFVKASCPLKLMDGLASGRQVVSAEVPECRLHEPWVRIYRNADEAIDLLGTAVDAAGCVEDVDRFASQIAYARERTWASRAREFRQILGRER